MKFERIKDKNSIFPFLQMPRFVWEMEELSLNAKVIYMLIYDRIRQGFESGQFTAKDGSSFCYYNDEELASQLKLTTRTVRRAIVELKEKGLVERERTNTKDGKSVTFALVPLGADMDVLTNASSGHGCPNLTDTDVLTNASSGHGCPNLTDTDVLTYRTQMSAPFPYISNNNMSNNNRTRKEASVPKPKKITKSEQVTQAIIEHWNKAYGTKYSSTTKGTIKLVDALLKSGYTQDDILQVIDYRAKTRRSEADYKWFVPATVLALKNFDRSYQFMINDQTKPQTKTVYSSQPNPGYRRNGIPESNTLPEWYEIKESERASESDVRKILELQNQTLKGEQQ